MKMRNLFLILILVAIFAKLSGQEISIYGQRKLWHADNLCDIEFAGCDWSTLNLNQGRLLGYAYHPNGSLWLVVSERIDTDHFQVKIYKVDIESCTYTLLYNLPLPFKWHCSNAANIDHQGRLYLNVNEFDQASNTSTRTLSRIANPEFPTIERLFVYFPNQNIYEIHFQNNRVYIPETGKPYIYVFDINFNLLDTLIMQKHIWGLTSFSFGCDSLITYATHMNISTQEYISNQPDSTMYISEFDIETNTLSPVCSYFMGNNLANTQLTSPLEFLSSDPECDLLIDLDRDNSTGVYPYDYLDSTEYCTTLEAPICDADLYIHTSAPLDSIVLIISGIQEPGDEQLILSGLPTGITFIQKNDSTYILISSDPADSIYQKALLAIRYQHTGSSRTPGSRRIILQGFNAIKDGVLITATISIAGLPFAGDDATLLICTDTLIQDLSSITFGQPDGYWSPLLSGGGNLFDSQVDQASSYQYIVIDPVCGNDTAVVTVNRDASAPVDLLGDDQVLCPGDTMEVTITQNALTILWDDGSTDTIRELTQSGSYWVSLETSGGCTYSDSLVITEGQLWNPSIQTKDPICDLSNGQLTIDPIEFQQNQTILINGALITSPNLGSLAQGVYEITAVSNDGCITNTSVTLTNQPLLSIAVDTQAILIEGVWEAMEYIEQNNVPVADILFDPAAYIRWTGSEIEIFGDQDTQYEITFVDENGCTDVHVLHVLVEKAQGIYLPNIFSPSSIAGNDVWTPSISESYALEVLRIYDRWGNMVHQSRTNTTWDGSKDGKECQAGVFVYQLILKHVTTGDRKVMMGDITLLK